MRDDAAPMRRWSTDAVPAGQRLDYWVGAICEAFLEMDCDSRAAPAFGGELTSLTGEQITYNQVHAATQDVYRTRAGIARGRSHPFYLITQETSAWHVRQGGQTVHLRPGDAVLVDSSQCYELHFPQAVSCLSIQMPRAWLGAWLRDLDHATARVVHRDRGWGRSLSALCLQFADDLTLAGSYPPQLLADQVGAMLAASLEEPAASRPPGAALVAGAHRVIAERLDEPGLTAADVAAQLGVSTRSLHRAFQAAGSTFFSCLRGARMARARDLLSQARLSGLSIAALGQRCGYTDASHFAREFSRATGEAPSRWRRRAA